MRVNKEIAVESHKGKYSVAFTDLFSQLTDKAGSGKNFYLVDANVARLYSGPLAAVLKLPECVLIEATESNKSYEKVGDVMQTLLELKIKRNDTIVAIGGGIIQDITAFICSIMFRGLQWRFYPTTLLAQADSCMGSKSSINFREFKNQVGTFNPPVRIHISTDVLKTLSPVEIRSGIGEIIKIHLLAKEPHWKYVEESYDSLTNSFASLEDAVQRSLMLKKKYVEEDEFDQNSRLVLNYGHTFGHALESATDFKIPHGIAVTMGMDLANFYSYKTNRISKDTFLRLHGLLFKNYQEYKDVPLDLEVYLKALSRDKKNTATNLMLILMQNDHAIQRTPCLMDEELQKICHEFFTAVRKTS